MKIIRPLLLGLMLVSGTCLRSATQAPAPQEPAPAKSAYSDSFIYALIHASANHMYTLGTNLLRSSIESKLVEALVSGQGSVFLSREKLFTLGAASHLIWAASLWGRYQLPAWVNHGVFGKTQDHSDAYKILSFANRAHFGFTGAFVESFLENEADKVHDLLVKTKQQAVQLSETV